ncbi:MAG: radical SAM protein [Thermodesulfovibrionales bacterium]|nr:radical SAM protein [Thermodesulfovibrionales bacterium]
MMNPVLRFLPHVLWKRRPIHLTLFLTKRCNARCQHCFYINQDDSPSKENEMSPEMSTDEYEKLSKEMGSLIWLAFSGGEIFLRDDLPEISRVFYRNNKPSIMLYPTNGLMPDKTLSVMEQVLNECPESIVTVKLSIDAVGDKHDQMRGRPGSFDLVIETHQRLKGLLAKYMNFELGINTLISHENQQDMDSVIDYVRKMDGVRTHTISLVRGDVSRGLKDVDPALYEAAIKRLEAEFRAGTSPVYSFRGAKLKAAQDLIQRRIIHKIMSGKGRQIPCYAGRLNLVVTEGADVYPCEEFKDSFKLGNLRDAWGKGEGLGEILASSNAREVIKRIGDTCFCTHECYLMTNILFNPCQHPALLREYLTLKPGCGDP